MTNDARIISEREQKMSMVSADHYDAVAYHVVKALGTEPLWATMHLDAANALKWLVQVGRCFELASVSYDRDTQMMTATFRPGNGLALIGDKLAETKI